MHHNIQMLGNGVYPISEAARYIQIQDSTLRYWFKSKEYPPLLHSDYSWMGISNTISFYDLIDALVAGLFRKEGIPSRRVRDAYRNMQDKLNAKHPFCFNTFYLLYGTME